MDPPNGSARLMRTSTRGGRREGPLTEQGLPMARSQGPQGDFHTQQCTPLACRQVVEEAGGPPNQHRARPACGQGKEGANPTRKSATLVCSQEEEEWGEPPEL